MKKSLLIAAFFAFGTAATSIVVCQVTSNEAVAQDKEPESQPTSKPATQPTSKPTSEPSSQPTSK